MISQTSGHGDFRFLFEVPRTLGGPLSHSEVEGMQRLLTAPMRSACEPEATVESRPRVRSNSWAVAASARLSIRLNQPSILKRRFGAAVEAAENWGTYVTVHAYMPRAIREAVAAGVK